MTLLELTVASAMLLLVLGVFLGSLVSNQDAEQYTRLRNEALDDLRLMANAFAKEARQATRVTTNGDSRMVMDTSVAGVTRSVTYEVVAGGAGVRDLRRVQGSSVRVFNVHLTSASVFTYNDGGVIPPQDVRSVRISVGTRLSPRYPPVSLTTEVSLRNVL